MVSRGEEEEDAVKLRRDESRLGKERVDLKGEMKGEDTRMRDVRENGGVYVRLMKRT